MKRFIAGVAAGIMASAGLFAAAAAVAVGAGVDDQRAASSSGAAVDPQEPSGLVLATTASGFLGVGALTMVSAHRRRWGRVVDLRKQQAQIQGADRATAGARA